MNNGSNIIGDELLLNFGAKLQNCHGKPSYVSVPRWRRKVKML